MKNTTNESFFKKNWFQGILAFCCVQIVFLAMEWTGWIPKYRDFDGKFLGNLIEVLQINEWATFYQTTFFNLVTVIFGIVVLAQIGFGVLQLIFRKIFA